MKNSEMALNALKIKMNSYANISEETWSEFEKFCSIENIPKGSYLIRTGEIPKSMHFVFKGLFRTFIYGGEEGDKEVIKNFFDEGKFPASVVALLNNEESEFTMDAIEDSVVVTINYKKFRELLKKSPDLMWFHINYLETHWVKEKEPNELSLLDKDSKKRYLNFLRDYPGIADRVPLYFIASRLGVTPTQLSRIRKELQD